MSRHRYEIQTCARCDHPINVSGNLKGKLPIEPRMGISVEIGFSDGGWGCRQNHISYSKEVCGDCYGEIMAMCQPVIEFLQRPRDERGGKDNVPPMRRNELESERHHAEVLRALPPLDQS